MNIISDKVMVRKYLHLSLRQRNKNYILYEQFISYKTLIKDIIREKKKYLTVMLKSKSSAKMNREELHSSVHFA